MLNSFPSPRRFINAKHGNVAMILALSILPILAVVGSAIDINRMRSTSVQMQSILDHAVLAATNMKSPEDPEVLLREWVGSQMQAQGYDLNDLTIQVNADVQVASKAVQASSSLELDTVIMHIFGSDQVRITVSSEATQSVPYLEVAMALDISSSMSHNGKLNNMKRATKEFIDQVLIGDMVNSTSVSIVPYGGTVNIGDSLFRKFAVPMTAASTILDPTSAEYAIGSNVNSAKFRFTDGYECIELLQSDYDTGMLPTQSRAQVPDFWKFRVNHPWCPARKSSVFLNSNNAEALKAHVNGFIMSDGTGTDSGALWGVKALSPSFRGAIGGDFPNRPMDFDEPGVLKILVLMSDGAITAQNRPKDPAMGNVHQNRTSSIYKKSHRNTATLTGGDRRNEQTTLEKGGWTDSALADNAVGRFKKICEAAKAKNILIYTIGFEIPAGGQGERNLKQCATSDAHYFLVDGGDLSGAFNTIASNLTELRITR